MSSRLNIYDHFGNWLVEIDASIKWESKLNEFGSGTFTMSTQDPKCREDYLQFGNFIYVEHDKLPTWCGMIDTPRVWGHGSVTSTIFSAEYLLTCMVTTRSMTAQGTPGTIYQQLIEQMFNNDIGDIIRVGEIYGGGKSAKRTYYYGNLYEEVKKLCYDNGNDFELLPAIDDSGKLYFAANWYEKRGSLKPLTLCENTNIGLSNTPLREQGRIGNKLRIYTSGATFAARGVAWRNDPVSAGKYGQRWMAQLQQGNDLDANADALLLEHANPRKTFDITVIDEFDPTKVQPYKQIRIGDLFPVSLNSVGFSGSGFGTEETIRVLQMKFDDEKNELKIVADQVKDG